MSTNLERKLIAAAFRKMARGLAPKDAYASSAGFYLARKKGAPIF